MSKSEQESIYQWITRMYEQHPVLPYTFQDVELDGYMEHKYIATKGDLPVLVKEKMTIELIRLIDLCLEDSNNRSDLQHFLIENRLFFYLGMLRNRIKIMISEGLLNKRKLYSFGMDLATKSSIKEEVQLGMVLISFNENDLTKKVMKTLGMHSAFTFYAVEAAENFSDYNQFLYELVQHTSGYGKLYSLHMFCPLKHEQKQFLFHQGAFNEVEPNLSAMICLDKLEMEPFFEQLTLNEVNFSKLSYLLAYAGEELDLKRFSISLVVIEKYMEVAKQFANTFIDLAALIGIASSMMPIVYNRDELVTGIGWDEEKQREIFQKCNKILSSAKWKYILLQELENPSHQTSLIVKVMRRLNVVPEFEALIPLLENDVFNMDLMEFLLIDNSDQYIEEVYELLLNTLPENVFDEEPQIIDKDELTPEYVPDVLTLFLLKALKREHVYKEDFILKCVSARYSDVRIEAIKTLRSFKDEWSPIVRPTLEKALKNEPDAKIKKRISRLLDKKYEKEQVFVDTTHIFVKPSPWDIPLIKTNIAGTFYRDMEVVQGRIDVGDILYLIREPDNPYDPKAILVTNDEGYVLGYVPKDDNSIPASMLDEGENLYAVLESEIYPNSKPTIQIMINKRPKQVGKIIPFPSHTI